MTEDYKEVFFDQYCKTCQYEKLDEKMDPCNECMDYGYNAESNKPVMWEEKKK